MSGAQLQLIIARQRAQRLLHVFVEPQRYMVCEGCSSLLFRSHAGSCPFCKAYRFDETCDGVLRIAEQVRGRPLAIGCPLLPRDISVRGLAEA